MKMKLADVKNTDFSFLGKYFGECSVAELFPLNKTSMEYTNMKTMELWSKKFDDKGTKMHLNPFFKFHEGYKQAINLRNATHYWCKYIEVLLEFLQKALFVDQELPFWKEENKSMEMIKILQFLTTLFRIVELTSSYGLVSDELNDKWYFGSTIRKSIPLKDYWLEAPNNKYTISRGKLPEVFNETSASIICDAKSLTPGHCDRMIKYSTYMVTQESALKTLFGDWKSIAAYAKEEKIRRAVRSAYVTTYEDIGHSMERVLLDAKRNLRKFLNDGGKRLLSLLQLRVSVDASQSFGHVVDVRSDQTFHLFSSEAALVSTELWQTVTSLIQKNHSSTNTTNQTEKKINIEHMKNCVPKGASEVVPTHQWQNTPKKRAKADSVIDDKPKDVSQSLDVKHRDTSLTVDGGQHGKEPKESLSESTFADEMDFGDHFEGEFGDHSLNIDTEDPKEPLSADKMDFGDAFDGEGGNHSFNMDTDEPKASLLESSSTTSMYISDLTDNEVGDKSVERLPLDDDDIFEDDDEDDESAYKPGNSDSESDSTSGAKFEEDKALVAHCYEAMQPIFGGIKKIATLQNQIETEEKNLITKMKSAIMQGFIDDVKEIMEDQSFSIVKYLTVLRESFKKDLEEIERLRPTKLSSKTVIVNRKSLVIIGQVAVCIWLAIVEALFPNLLEPFCEKFIAFIDSKLISDKQLGSLTKKESVELSYRLNPHSPKQSVSLPLQCFYDLSTILRATSNIDKIHKPNKVRLPDYRAKHIKRLKTSMDLKIVFTRDLLLQYAIAQIPAAARKRKTSDGICRDVLERWEEKLICHNSNGGNKTKENPNVSLQGKQNSSQGPVGSRQSTIDQFITNKKVRRNEQSVSLPGDPGYPIVKAVDAKETQQLDTSIGKTHEDKSVTTRNTLLRDGVVDNRTVERDSLSVSTSVVISCDLAKAFDPNNAYKDVVDVNDNHKRFDETEGQEATCPMVSSLNNVLASATPLNPSWIMKNEALITPSKEAKVFNLIKRLILKGLIGTDGDSMGVKVTISLSTETIIKLLQDILFKFSSNDKNDKEELISIVEVAFENKTTKVKYSRLIPSKEELNKYNKLFGKDKVLQLVSTMNALAYFPPTLNFFPIHGNPAEYRSEYYFTHNVVHFYNKKDTSDQTKQGLLSDYEKMKEKLLGDKWKTRIEQQGFKFEDIMSVVDYILWKLKPTNHKQPPSNIEDRDDWLQYCLYCPTKQYPVVLFDTDDTDNRYMILSQTNFHDELYIYHDHEITDDDDDIKRPVEVHSKEYVEFVLKYGRGNALFVDKDMRSFPLLMKSYDIEERTFQNACRHAAEDFIETCLSIKLTRPEAAYIINNRLMDYLSRAQQYVASKEYMTEALTVSSICNHICHSEKALPEISNESSQEWIGTFIEAIKNRDLEVVERCMECLQEGLLAANKHLTQSN